MRSRYVSRALLLLLLPAVTFGLGSCRMLGRSSEVTDPPGAEEAITGTLLSLIPDGRIFSNNLSADKPQHMARVFLFEGELVLEDKHGRLTSIDRENLDPKWYFTGLPGPVRYDIVASPISILGVSENILYEIDRKYGTQRSAHPLDFIPSASPSATDSTAYVPALAARAGHRTLITVNLATGIEGWGLSTRGSIATNPVAGGTSSRPRIYFVTENAGIYSLPAVTAVNAAPEPSWTHGAHGRVVSGVVMDRDLVLVGSEKGELWALDRITGATAWVHYSGEPIRSSAWASGDQVYFVNGDGFHALDRETGKELWCVGTLDLGEEGKVRGPLTFLVRRDDAVYVSGAPGVVMALDPASGELLRWERLGSHVMLVTNQMDHLFYAVTKGGFVFCVDKQIE